jgi:hypothetical protein
MRLLSSWMDCAVWKEIFEQPNSIRDAMRGRLSIEECTAKLGGLNMSSYQPNNFTREAESVARILSGRQLVEVFELDNGNIFLVFHGGLHFGIRGSGF